MWKWVLKKGEENEADSFRIDVGGGLKGSFSVLDSQGRVEFSHEERMKTWAVVEVWVTHRAA